MTWPLSRQLTTAIPGDSFDGWQNFWNLWWVKVALVDRVQWPMVTDLLYAPTGVGLYFHTLNPFNGLVTLPVQVSGNLFLAYNSVVFISWVLGGYGVFLLVRWLLRGRAGMAPRFGGPFVAGLIFTFAPFHMAHLLGHMQVMSLQWLPFYLLYLLQATERAKSGRAWLRHALLAGLFLILVGLCDWYYVLYLFLFTGFYIGYWVLVGIGYWVLGIVGGWGMAPRPRRFSNTQYPIPNTRFFLPPIVAGLLFVMVLSPLLLPMVQEALRFDFMQRPESDLYILSAAVMDFLVPNRLHSLFRPESFTWPGNQIAPVSERTISIGYLPLLLALAGLWMDRRRAGLWMASALFFLLIALGPALNVWRIDFESVARQMTQPGWSLYGLLNESIPFMRISRSVSRFAVMVQLGVAVAGGIGLAWLTLSQTRMRRALLAGLAGGIVLAEFWVAPYFISPPDTPDFYTVLAGEADTRAVLNLPMNYDRPGYLLYQTVHQKPLTVAYISRDDPRTLTERMPPLQHFRHLGPDILDVDPAAIGLSSLHEINVGWVILDRYKMPGGLERSYTTELAQAIFAGHAPFFEDERITVFRVPEAVTPAAYLSLGAAGWGPLSGEAGAGYREIRGEEAILALHHLPTGSRLQIDYRTSPAQSLSLRGLAGEGFSLTLPPAPQGEVAEIDLAPLLDGGDLVELGLAPVQVGSEAGSQPVQPIQIRAIRLQLP
jgi:hypothetical protein